MSCCPTAGPLPVIRGRSLGVTVPSSAAGVHVMDTDIFVGGANLLGFVQGIQKLRPKLCAAQRRRCFDKFIQCRSVLLPQLVLLLAAAWHVPMMQQSVRGLRGRVVHDRPFI